ncbi:galactoside alpha-(1,2)-fucosyltransferase 2-like [Amphibalanus amphitrite]|uniref:galactoside alpha-(1,2)-fucosyltransferase 2-like n=1 Tax=Amphibalanus amphitrite TaxID=1232801 RepID=UPI001C8FD19C|nr:galactoside alpha-(1,2)-fucosyltransferase 2-like [Amphibalanus amphitrite]
MSALGHLGSWCLTAGRRRSIARLFLICAALLALYALSKSRPQVLEGPRPSPEDEQRLERSAAPACPPSECLISAAKGGRLGNIMFEYATLLAASHILQRPVWLLAEMKDILEKYFEPLSTPALPRGCEYNWTEISIDALIKNASKDDEQSYLIGGYPTSVHLFHPIRDRVLREFTFRPELPLSADRRLAELARQVNMTSPTFIGVHVRRTDYAQWLPKMVEGRLVDRDFLERALALMRSRHRDALFVVVSDDLEWCRRELVSRANSSDIVLAGDGVQSRPGADLALLAACNHFIITHGTFGFWGAYMSGGEVVKPTGYGQRKTGVENNVRHAGLNWTWIEAFTSQTTAEAAEIVGGRRSSKGTTAEPVIRH